MIEVTVVAAVRPTEKADRVAEAVLRLFPDLTMDITSDRVQGYGGLKALQRLYSLLREERILDTARQVMHGGRLGQGVQFRLSKVAAFMGRISFPPEEEPLGSIHVRMSGSDLLVDWLAPRTVNGVPIMEIDLKYEDDAQKAPQVIGNGTSQEINSQKRSEGGL